jgi:hypothetical protein
MYRSCMSGLLASIAGLASVTQAVVGQQVCRPALAFTEVRFSEMQLPTMERKWTAVVSVDASRCAMNSAGYFEDRLLADEGNRRRHRLFREIRMVTAVGKSRGRFLG